MQKKKEVKKTPSKKDKARAGEFWSVNNSRTKGHKGLITKRKKSGDIDYVSVTHSKKTQKRKNKKLIENPDSKDIRTAYVLPKLQHGKIKDLGKKHSDMKIKNKTDKSIIRKIKAKGKKKK